MPLPIGAYLYALACVAMLLACPPLLLAEQFPSTLPDAPLSVVQMRAADAGTESSSLALDPQTESPTPVQSDGMTNPAVKGPADANANPVPLERREPQRILGLMPNFRTVSGGASAPPPGWKYNLTVANQQALDYSSFIFLGLTSLSAEGINTHPVFGKGPEGFTDYAWRGFLDKTDNTYLSAWLLSSALHEDTRYYALGSPHRIVTRVFYVISQQAVARTYGGRNTPNIASLGGKVLTQVFSQAYYPPSATTLEALATKFGYSVMRDVGLSAVREFYPDVAAHYIRKHREKLLRLQQQLQQRQQP